MALPAERQHYGHQMRWRFVSCGSGSYGRPLEFGAMKLTQK
jgi:hypothetical protein